MGRTDRGARGSPADARPVEFLTPRAELFDTDLVAAEGAGGDGGVAAFSDVDDDAPRSRWTTIGAAIGILALVAVGVVAASPWHHDDSSASPPTTTLAPSTTLAMTDGPAATQSAADDATTGDATTGDATTGDATTGGATGPAADPPLDPNEATDGYLLDPVLLPAGWRSEGGLSPMTVATQQEHRAEDVAAGDERRVAHERNGWLELWATPAATRTTGSWFAVQYTPGARPFAVQDAARISLGRRVGLLTTSSDGVSSMSFADGQATATITWFGWSQAAIVEMASTITFGRSGKPHFADTGFQSAHVQLLARRSFGVDLEQDLFMTDVVSTAHYREDATSGVAGTIDITTRRADPDLDVVLASFVVSSPMVISQPSTIFMPIGADSVFSGDVHYPAASAPQNLHLVQWTVGDLTVQLATTIRTEQLFTDFPLGLVGPGTVGAWQRQQLGIGTSTFVQRPSVDLGSGALPDGGVWQMNVQPDIGWVNAFVTSPDQSRGIVVQMDLGFRACGTAASKDTTIIFCLRPAELGAAALRVEGDWGSFDEPFVPVGDDGYWVGVVHEFGDIGGYRASIIGPNGITTPVLALGELGATSGA